MPCPLLGRGPARHRRRGLEIRAVDWCCRLSSWPGAWLKRVVSPGPRSITEPTGSPEAMTAPCMPLAPCMRTPSRIRRIWRQISLTKLLYQTAHSAKDNGANAVIRSGPTAAEAPKVQNGSMAVQCQLSAICRSLPRRSCSLPSTKRSSGQPMFMLALMAMTTLLRSQKLGPRPLSSLLSEDSMWLAPIPGCLYVRVKWG